MKAEAAKYGYTLVVVDANRDNAKQQSQVEDFISNKVDAIVLTPYDSTAIGSAIAEANKAEHSGIYRRYREHEQTGYGGRAHRERQRARRHAGRETDLCRRSARAGQVAIHR